MGARSTTEVLSDLNICTEGFVEEVVKVVTTDNYLSQRMLKSSKPVSGGKYIAVPLEYGTNHARTMGRYDQIQLQPRETMDEARFNWKWVNDTVVIDEQTMKVENVGKEQLINLAESKYKNLAVNFKDKFTSLLYSTSVGTNDPDSVYTICATQNNTVGGIDASASGLGFSWNPKILDLESAAPTFDNLIDPTSAYYLENILQAIYASLSVGQDKPTIAITTQVVWDAYEAILRNAKRFDAAYEADGGFDVLKFRHMKLVVDENVPGGSLNSATYSQMYVLNENYIGYRHKIGMDFKATKWEKVQLQHVFFSEMNWHGGFVCSRRDRQGCVKGLPIVRGSLTVS